MTTPGELHRLVEAADAAIRPWVPVSPWRESPGLSGAVGGSVWVKEEHLLPSASFKLRGAFNKLLGLTDAERAQGIVTASSGNHGAATAWAAAALGIRARVYVPVHASPAKIAKIEAKGAEVVRFGTDGLDTELEARAVAAREGVPYVSPYNDVAVMAGQGTAAAELTRQGPLPDRLYVSVGGGGLVGGMSAWLRVVAPGVRIVGVVPANSPVMALSVAAGHIVEVETSPTLSDGTAGGIEPGAITFPICRDLVHEWVTIDEAPIASAMRLWSRHEPGAIEGSAGVALAALLADASRHASQRLGVVICGGNIAPDRWQVVTA